jgi:hypothetical protein
MSEFVFCIECSTPRDMDANGLVEECPYCHDPEYIRSDFPDTTEKRGAGYIQSSEPRVRIVIQFEEDADDD